LWHNRLLINAQPLPSIPRERKAFFSEILVPSFITTPALNSNHNMLFGVYFLLLAGAGIGMYPPPSGAYVTLVVDVYFVAAPNPVKVVMSTEVSAIRLGHAAANARPPLGPGGQPTKMRHLCKDMQQAVQNTAIRLLTFIGISGPSLSGTTPVSEGRFSGVRVTYHKIFPVPVIDPVFALEESRLHPDGTVMHHHEVHRFHKDGQPGGPFLNRVHHALMSLGPWEGRIVAFVLGEFHVLRGIDSTLSIDGACR
jgi:hypothetical protein